MALDFLGWADKLREWSEELRMWSEDLQEKWSLMGMEGPFPEDIKYLYRKESCSGEESQRLVEEVDVAARVAFAREERRSNEFSITAGSPSRHETIPGPKFEWA